MRFDGRQGDWTLLPEVCGSVGVSAFLRSTHPPTTAPASSYAEKATIKKQQATRSTPQSKSDVAYPCRGLAYSGGGGVARTKATMALTHRQPKETRVGSRQGLSRGGALHIPRHRDGLGSTGQWFPVPSPPPCQTQTDGAGESGGV